MRGLPQFRYHPDPVATGSVEDSENRCGICDRVAGYVYVGPVYSAVSQPAICIWCIADGSAAHRLDAEFTDRHPWVAEVPASVAQEVLTRTPGFVGWQQERWMAHCGDAAIFLGPVGAPELERFPAQAAAALREDADSWGWTQDELDQYMGALDRDGSPTGYLFQCAHCGAFVGYSDYD